MHFFAGKISNKWLPASILWLGLYGTLWAQPSGTIRIINPGSVALTKTVIEVPWAAVLSAYLQVDTAQLRVVEAGSGREVAYQLERRGKKTIQNLLVQLTLSPKQQIQLAFRKGKPTPVVPKTYGRYVPERYDDFAWENDRIAFRIYGAALDGRSDNAFGTDVWAKRTDGLVINKWYKGEDYHKDHGEGLDYYSVGLKLGAGDVGVLLADTIGYIHNYKTWEVLDNGPLRTTFRVGYAPYTFNGVEVNTTKTFSLDAGSQLSRVEVQVTHSSPAPLPMVAGISLRPEPGQLLLNETQGILGYWEPTHGPDGTLGIGCIFPEGNIPMDRKYGHGLAKINVRSGEPLVYYTGAAWDKAGLITSGDAWFDYLSGYATYLKNPPLVQIEK
jgi:hypothetical protein